ncbi:MAG: hypothetical protein RIC06_18175 [Cyclobacteriaceae bacterium]
MKGYYFGVFLLGLFLLGCEKDRDIILNVKELKGKTDFEITQILGKPDSTYTKSVLGKKIFIQVYKDLNHAELRYTKSDTINSIVINKPFDLDFSPETLAKFGLPVVPPTTKDTSAFFNWKNLEGLSNVTLYKIGSKMPEGVSVNYHIYFDLQ